MLARRFTIVCLLVLLFGMFFAVLVERVERRPRPWQSGQVTLCGYEASRPCPRF